LYKHTSQIGQGFGFLAVSYLEVLESSLQFSAQTSAVSLRSISREAATENKSRAAYP